MSIRRSCTLLIARSSAASWLRRAGVGMRAGRSMKRRQDMLLFTLEASRALGEAVAGHLGCALGRIEEREFDGGEHKVRTLDEVGGRDVYVLHSLHAEPGNSANDKLVRLLFFFNSLKDAGAGRVTAIVPYLAYSRKDRRTKPRDPVNSRYVATLFEAVGTDRMVTLEVHNVSAFENAFRLCRPEHVPSAGLFADFLAGELTGAEVAVVSPDAGANKRAELLRHELEKRLNRPVGKAIMDKHRSMGVVSGNLFAGDLRGRTAIIFDDLIASGTTIVRAAKASREAGASRVIAAAAHGMFPADSPLFGPDGPDRLLVTDSIPLAADLPAHARAMIAIVSASGLLGDIISCIDRGDAVSDLIVYD
ncbi:ribose-phosphate diphosphokinase [Novosphingobium sp. KCTC 2891]|uniref:ribose-phosphate diphosphokinase n=1 Tax=Novosphingobium sp. KCTC 2891 TaxID=2989730 RepID=UPI002222E1C2|nr:ribose-phosphate diphosphokinase [Novosphingobium sp. KCTC 2891]MCW1382950.1 ribose-phosphate diphosphokinase [Novosphingobium sp. KCTC 2891]